jgi:pyridoxine 4-dehydrogenase
MARVDKKIEIEEVMKTLKSLISEGKFNHIGLSEVSAKTIERAHKIHPISAVEIEYSPVSCFPSNQNKTKKTDYIF